MRWNVVKNTKTDGQLLSYWSWTNSGLYVLPSSQWRDCIPPIHNISLKCASSSLVYVIGKLILFFQLGNLHLRFDSGVVENLEAPLITEKSFIDKFVKRKPSLERGIVPLPSSPVTFISDYTPASDLLDLLKRDPDAATNTEYLYEIIESTSLFRVPKYILISLDAEASVCHKQ